MTARIPSMRTTIRLLALTFLLLAAVGCPGHKKLALPGIFEDRMTELKHPDLLLIRAALAWNDPARIWTAATRDRDTGLLVPVEIPWSHRFPGRPEADVISELKRR